MRPVAGRAAVAGRVVDQLEFAVADVVVDRLRHTDAQNVQSPFLSEFGDLVGGIHRVVAADVAEIPHVMSTEHLDDPLEVLLLVFLQLVPAGADRAGRGRGPQQSDFLRILFGQVQQLFLQHALDAVPAGVDRADVVEFPRRLDQTAEAVVDHRRWAAGLGHNQILLCHRGFPVARSRTDVPRQARHRSRDTSKCDRSPPPIPARTKGRR